jgi:demethylmenaquinone methyltransferase/2-methoxy-6-polyprenyl-1,4-benzoquinol methylase
VATGTGLVARALTQQYDCQVVALDQSADMLGQARELIARDPAAAARITLIQGMAEELPFADAEFDHVTFTYLLRYVDDPPATLRELGRVCKPGGRMGCLEFGVPARAPLRTAWRAYTRLGLPLLGRIISDDWAEVGRFLGPSIEDFYRTHPLPRQAEYWRDAGFREVTIRRMSLGAGVVMHGVRDGA